jgi:hypothetical protein
MAFRRKPRREIAVVKFPVHRLRAVLKGHAMIAQKSLQMFFIAAEVAEVGGVLEREFQRLQRVIKTDEANLARDVPRGAQDGERVGRRAQADIPDHKFAGLILEPLAQPELVDVKRLRLGDRPDDRMKRLAIRERTHGTDAVVQADELVAGVSLHGLVLRESVSAKRKTGNPPNTDCRLSNLNGGRPQRLPVRLAPQSVAIALSSAA